MFQWDVTVRAEPQSPEKAGTGEGRNQALQGYGELGPRGPWERAREGRSAGEGHG